MQLGFLARGIYLVIGGRGTVQVEIDGRPTRTVTVGGIPKLYTLFDGAETTSGTLLLHIPPGVQAYDFTYDFTFG